MAGAALAASARLAGLAGLRAGDFLRLCTPLPRDNSGQLPWKQSFYPVIISICVSLRSYMLDVVAIFAVKRPDLRIGRWPD